MTKFAKKSKNYVVRKYYLLLFIIIYYYREDWNDLNRIQQLPWKKTMLLAVIVYLLRLRGYVGKLSTICYLHHRRGVFFRNRITLAALLKYV